MKEETCNKCKNTNGEHKPGCSFIKNLAKKIMVELVSHYKFTETDPADVAVVETQLHAALKVPTKTPSLSEVLLHGLKEALDEHHNNRTLIDELEKQTYSLHDERRMENDRKVLHGLQRDQESIDKRIAQRLESIRITAL
jgi:ATP-dependent Lon protease